MSLENNTSFLKIDYLGEFSETDKIYVEYMYENNTIQKNELTINGGLAYAILPITSLSTFSFRFVKNDQIINKDNVPFKINILNTVVQNDTTVTPTVTETPEIVEEDKIFDEELSLVPVDSRKGLSFSYKLNKRIRLLFIKLFRRLPSFITGNYRRRINL